MISSKASLKAKIFMIVLVVLIPLMLIIQFFAMPKVQQRMLDDRKAKIKANIDVVMSMIHSHQKCVEDGMFTQEEAQNRVKKIVQDLRYEGSEYYWINDFTPNMILHPIKADLNGKFLGEMKDPNGVFLFNEMVKTVKEAKAGFVAYDWPKPGEDLPQPKLSYVMGDEKWGWIIGTGVYIDDVNKAVSAFKQSLWLGIGFVALLAALFSAFTINSITKHLNHISGELADSGSKVADAVSQLKAAGDGLSTSATETAASLEETVASLEELTSMVNVNTQNSQAAADLSQRSQETAKRGEGEIQTLIVSMREIEGASKRIEEIIGVIDDIAFQTNLLALNASVEAARAGDHGKGFAVVADAVRTLAQRSATAAKDIGSLIRDSVDKIHNGAQIADKTGLVFTEIVKSVSQVASLNSEIATASAEQTTGIQQISQAMNQLDQAAQSNAAVSEEIAAATDDINILAAKTNSMTMELDEVIRGARVVSR